MIQNLSFEKSVLHTQGKSLCLKAPYPPVQMTSTCLAGLGFTLQNIDDLKVYDELSGLLSAFIYYYLLTL